MTQALLLDTQVFNFNNFSGTQIRDKILNHEAPRKLLNNIPSHELLLLFSHVGAEDCLEIVELLAPEQVKSILDLSIWHNDKIMSHMAGNYFSLLFAANPDQAIKQIMGLDIELTGLMIKQVAQIYDTTLGEDLEDYPELVSTSPDKRFIIAFSENPETKSLAQSMYMFLENMYNKNLELILVILERIKQELASGLEETCYQLRTNRLLDLGILPHEERLSYFAPISANFIINNTNNNKTNSNSNSSSIINNKNSNNNMNFFSQIFAEISHDLQQVINQQINHTTRNMFMSLSGDFSSLEKLQNISQYIKNLINIGLIQASKNNLDYALSIIKNNKIKNLVRLARTNLINLRKNLNKYNNNSNFLVGENFNYLDSPLREAARGLNLSEPQFYLGLLDPKKLIISYFENLDQILHIITAIKEIHFRSLLAGPKGLGLTPELLKNNKLSHSSSYARVLINKFNSKNNLDITKPNINKIFDQENNLDKNFIIFAREQEKFYAQKLEKLNLLPNINTHMRNFTISILAQLAQNPQNLVD